MRRTMPVPIWGCRMIFSAEQERLKAAYIRARGYWTDWTEGTLRFSPGFLDLYARYGGYPAANGPLSPLMCELIYVALTRPALTFESGLRRMALAVKHGATPAQVMEVLAMATEQGLGVARGLARKFSPRNWLPRDRLCRNSMWRFQPSRRLCAMPGSPDGDWPHHADVLLRLDPGYFRSSSSFRPAMPIPPIVWPKRIVLIRLA